MSAKRQFALIPSDRHVTLKVQGLRDPNPVPRLVILERDKANKWGVYVWDAKGHFLADWLLTSHPKALQDAQEVFGISPTDWSSDPEIQSLHINQAAKQLLGVGKR